MGKHSRRSNKTVQRTAIASAVTFGATAALAGQAQAAEVHVPNTDLSFEVAGLENVPNIAAVPGIAEWVPSLAGQAAQADYSAIAAAPLAPPVVAQPVAEGQRVVDAARSKIGSPYVWGATGPNAFDCSGLTSWAYSQVGKHIPRTSYAQAAGGTPVSFNNLQAGDIIAFYSGASHVGIYSGHGTVIHAIQSGTPLSETSMDYMPFHSAVRY
ncbi:C40 family peptidase [Corynebacterium pygosceleis]|uniref:C40 family peptidase n=1 Tax=Corynebacterium pygosceleis TaxID=2800406 RepID=A0A9Q4C626_9CORY|nr:C40 family peptidase [Corynebacterium pygosceleis]MCK7636619.1 C40 family peptidase [Corynebacterium pygosceleis]MCK7675193.1 C40 family peptidase [Corynebacterium pygosceleis]MCX7444143.1 C40 family peptidase [Corynebacterium pygosceleis]MCX7467372.1 C40 family peptidase [Corynebacterium pygosceleis]